MNDYPPPPVRVTILAISGATMMTLASVIDPLRAANRLTGDQSFDWTLVSPDGEMAVLSGGLKIPVSRAFSSDEQGDVLIVVASFDHQQNAPSDLINTLRKAISNFDTVCGVESGTWLLARAGQIEKQRVTTHWEDLESLQQNYPHADVSDERFVMSGKIWTCGGASPALDMTLYLIEQKCTPGLALEVSSVFVYDQLHTASDRQPTMSVGMLEQKEPLVAAAVSMMEKNIDAPISTSAVARRIGVSAKTLETHFKRSLQTTPGHYHLHIRLKLARKLVLETQLGIQEIAVRTGFGSQSAFSRSFRKKFGHAPLHLRRGSRE